jgi:hypothetical protein
MGKLKDYLPGWWLVKPDGLIWNPETNEWENREDEKKEKSVIIAPSGLEMDMSDDEEESKCICFAGRSRYCPVDHD